MNALHNFIGFVSRGSGGRYSFRGGHPFLVHLAAMLLGIAGVTTTAGAQPGPDGHPRTERSSGDDGIGRRSASVRRNGFRPMFVMRNGLGGLLPGFQPDFLRRDLAFIARRLDLDDKQKAILEMFLLDYEVTFTEAAEGVRESLSGLRIGAVRDRDDSEPAVEAHREARRELRQELRALQQQIRQQGRGADGRPTVSDAEREKLHERYRELRRRMVRHRPPWDMNDAVREMQKTIVDTLSDWRSTRESLRDRFLTDLRAILAESQLRRWPQFERALRRMKQLPLGRLGGESVDLHRIVDDTVHMPDRRGVLDDLLTAYATELDGALRQREQTLASVAHRIAEALPEPDAEEMKALAEQIAAARVAVREVNERYAAQIAENIRAIDGAAAAAFDDAWRAEAYPRVYRTTSMQRALRTAMRMEHLSEDTRQALTELSAAYEAELAACNERIEAAIREADPARLVGLTTRLIAGPADVAPDRDDHLVPEAMQQRHQLDQTYLLRLGDLLGPERRAAIPGLQRQAEPDRSPAASRARDRWHRRVMQRYDINGDGQLDAAEREAMRRDRGIGRNEDDQRGGDD